MDSFIKTYSWLIPVLPLVGFLLNGVPTAAGVKLPRVFVSVTGCAVMAVSFLFSLFLFFSMTGAHGQGSFTTVLWPWFGVGGLHANLAFLFDPLSIVMCLVVTGVGFLIHVYSCGYMAKDPSYARFFAYLNLFCFMMLVLVLGDNLLLLFVGWEGVGLCSYLLIGFWFKEKANGAAGMKAFVVNRIGDFGMMLGLIILYWQLVKAGTPTLEFEAMRVAVGGLAGAKVLGVAAVTVICLLLFVGATGKSAQIPLYVWLPDAMAGPTPVSALIHAATMVTAGVYLIARLNWLFVLSPVALGTVATVGALTAFVGATIGFAQTDIKKVLAYSTVSQLGYMMLAMGSAAFSAGVFHLMTHAFFKACLFLGSGSVIMAMHHEQDMRLMGGLKKYLPITFATFFVATIAISGVFPLSGFFSKDEILWAAFSQGHAHPWYYVLWGLGFAAAMGTAFYMMRAMVLTFFGSLRANDPVLREKIRGKTDGEHAHETHGELVPKESPWTVTAPLVVLAFLSVVAGFFNVPAVINGLFGSHSRGLFNEWLAPVIPLSEHHAASAVEWVLMLGSVLVAVGGLYLGFWAYTRRNDLIKRFTERWAFLYGLVYNKYHVDEVYEFLFVQRLMDLNRWAATFDRVVIDGLVNLCGTLTVFYSRVSGWCDEVFVDGAVNGMARLVAMAHQALRRVQTGRIQHYAYGVVLGVVAIVLVRVLRFF